MHIPRVEPQTEQKVKFVVLEQFLLGTPALNVNPNISFRFIHVLPPPAFLRSVRSEYLEASWHCFPAWSSRTTVRLLQDPGV